jgi:predicted Zn-dependent protease
MATMKLSDFADLVACEFVAGELIARVEGVRVSMGRKKNGEFTYSKDPKAQAVLARAKAGEKIAPNAPPKASKRKRLEEVPTETTPVTRPRRRRTKAIPDAPNTD